VLGGYGYDESHFDGDPSDALEDRAAKDTIRRVHLAVWSTGLVKSILDFLTPNREDPRSNSVESFILWNQSKAPVDASDFLARNRFPKLQRPRLSNCSISSWDHLTSRTSALTTLKLDFSHPSPAPSPTPTVSQLLSILSSNPALPKVALLDRAVPDGGGSESSSRVQLHHHRGLIQFPNVRALSFDGVALSAAFPNPNLAGEGKVFPSGKLIGVRSCPSWPLVCPQEPNWTRS